MSGEQGEVCLHYDYTAVGHVTIDELPDGSRRPGGTAFYSALQAARLGLRALILTQGAPAEIEALLEPFRAELSLEVVPAPRTTTLRTRGSGSRRTQALLAWAGAMPADLVLDSGVLHIAPVARETPSSWRGRARLVGLTPQGLVRRWPDQGGEITLAGPEACEAQACELAQRCDALVVNEGERNSCGPLIDAAAGGGAAVAVTAGPRPTLLLRGRAGELAVDVRALPDPVDDLGAGDVFAAAFFALLAEGAAPERAAAFANAAAAVRMLGAGPQALGTRAAIERRMREDGRP